MNSSYMKERLAHYLYFRLGFIVICDEFEFMDIFGIRRSGYAVEYEIKVSKSDLNREIKCAIANLSDVEKYGKDWQKFSKHTLYQTGESPQTDYDKRMADLGISNNVTARDSFPSEFYFYIPEELEEYAVKKVAENNLPYGIIVCDKEVKSGFKDPYYIVKKAPKLHREKANSRLYRKLAHALTIRSRILQ